MIRRCESNQQNQDCGDQSYALHRALLLAKSRQARCVTGRTASRLTGIAAYCWAAAESHQSVHFRQEKLLLTTSLMARS